MNNHAEKERLNQHQNESANDNALHDKKRLKKLMGKAMSGTILLHRELIACREKNINVAPFITLDHSRHWGHDKNFISSKDVKDFILATATATISNFFLRVGNPIALNGIVVLGVSGVPPRMPQTSTDLLDDCIQLGSSLISYTREGFSEKFCSIFSLGYKLRYYGPGKLKSLHEAILYIPDEIEKLDLVINTNSSSKKSQNKRHKHICNAKVPDRRISKSKKPMPPPIHYILTHHQMKRNQFPMEPTLNNHLSMGELSVSVVSENQAKIMSILQGNVPCSNLLKSKMEASLIIQQLSLPGLEGYVSTQSHVRPSGFIENDQIPIGIPRLFGLDCEMCMTSEGLELCRVSLVDEKHVVLLDELVKPVNSITDYLTQWSGVNAEILQNVSTHLCQVQLAIISLVDQIDILVGHSLDNDLRALRLVHKRCIDTSLLFPNPRAGRKSSLRSLALSHLGRTIQDDRSGHNSIEDAVTALALAQLKIERGPTYGIVHTAPLLVQMEGPVTYVGNKHNCIRHGSVGKVNTIVKESNEDVSQAIIAQAAKLVCQLEKSVFDMNINDMNCNVPPRGLIWGDLQASPTLSLREYYAMTDKNAQDDHEGIVSERQQRVEDTILNIHKLLPKNMLLMVVAQADVMLVQEMLGQKKVCNDPRTASAWTEVQENKLNELIKQARDGQVFMTMT